MFKWVFDFARFQDTVLTLNMTIDTVCHLKNPERTVNNTLAPFGQLFSLYTTILGKPSSLDGQKGVPWLDQKVHC